MSGWACVFRRDAAPVSRADIEPLMPRLRARAPDGEAHAALPASAPSCALAMTVLDTRDRVPLARGPARVGPLTGVGQVRIDARDDVARALGISFADRVRMTDLELMVRAFLHWGDGVLAHVGGEYSGALFDERTREIVLFRDGFGVRQCFFAVVGPWLVASNSLRAVRAHAAVSDALDDDAILDFLLFDWIMDKEKTAFRDIARLHPGHVLRVDAARVRNAKSWILELPPVDRRSSMEELGLRWRDALDVAVKERLGERTSIFLSGGIDSTGIAASAAHVTEDRSSLFAVTAVSSRGGDEEGELAAAVAARIGVAHERVVGDALSSTAIVSAEPLDVPEPIHSPYACRVGELYSRAAAHGPVALDGEGGDEIWRSFPVRALVGRVPVSSIGVGVLSALRRGVRPDFETGIWTRLRGLAPFHREPPPHWLARAHQARCAARAAAMAAALQFDDLEGERARSLGALLHPLWAVATFARDPDVSEVAVDVRYPLLDRRVVEGALRLPSMPGAMGKVAARATLRDRLPAAVLRRPKSGVDDPFVRRVSPAPQFRELSATPGLSYYVDVERTALALEAGDAAACWTNMRPLSLARWLLALGSR